jgi:UDP-N-acetylmuramate dehydrogenase
MISDNSLSIKLNYDLQSLNTLAVPSRAEFFTEIKSDDDYLALLSFVKENQCDLHLLGGGSNVLLPELISGIVAKVETKERNIISETECDIVIRFSAGEEWHAVVMWCVENSFYGLENLALIPGSIGAAPIQNIGAYGIELKSCCENVEAIMIKTGEKKQLTREQCRFDYRDSVFKNELKDKIIITHVTLRLNKYSSDLKHEKKNINIQYPALKAQLEKFSCFEEKITALDIANAVIDIRKNKLPDPKNIPNAGSFFKNPIVTKVKMEEIQKRFSDVIAYPVEDKRFKLAAGWLIDKAGWKGKSIDGVAMHSQQALVLTNAHGVSSKQLLAFAAQVAKSINTLFNVDLEIEPRVF